MLSHPKRDLLLVLDGYAIKLEDDSGYWLFEDGSLMIFT